MQNLKQSKIMKTQKLHFYVLITFSAEKKLTLAENDSLQTFVLLQSKVIELQTSHKNVHYIEEPKSNNSNCFFLFKNEMKFKRHKPQTTIENKTSECINIIHALCCYGSIILTVSAFFSEFTFLRNAYLFSCN